MIPDQVAIVGAGRVGLSLARALSRSGRTISVLGRRATPLPEPLHGVLTDWAPPLVRSSLVIIAVPDDGLGAVALMLAGTGAITPAHCVLHTSGLHDRSALAALDRSGAALGSWHPLQTFALPAGEPAALAGSPAIIEGDERALAMGRQLAELLHLRPVIEMPAAGKAAYHASAVFASNYLMVLADVAARITREAVGGELSGELFLPLMRRTVANYGSGGASKLTGPITRGDVGTVARHLEALSGTDRALYVALGREALRLARTAGLADDAAAKIEALLY